MPAASLDVISRSTEWGRRISKDLVFVHCWYFEELQFGKLFSLFHRIAKLHWDKYENVKMLCFLVLIPFFRTFSTFSNIFELYFNASLIELRDHQNILFLVHCPYFPWKNWLDTWKAISAVHCYHISMLYKLSYQKRKIFHRSV